MRLKKGFFSRDPEIVARELLCKILIRIVNKKKLKARIVETEAYYDEKDPASWARFNGKFKKTMEMDPGTILVKKVHNNCLLNFVTGNKGEASAVLIRAIEPINFNEKCNGPGLLTKSINIDSRFNRKNLINNKEIWIESSEGCDFEIKTSFRIGVTKDLKKHLRFFIKDDKFISKK